MKRLWLLIFCGSLAIASPPQYYSTTTPSGEVTYWEITSGTADGDGVPLPFDPDQSYSAGNELLNKVCRGTDNILYVAITAFGFPSGAFGFDPSGGVLTPVFWELESQPLPSWTAQSYAQGDGVLNDAGDGKNYFANEAVIATDVPGVSSKWTLIDIRAWTPDDEDHPVGDWVNIGGDFYKALIASGTNYDWGFQDPGGPTQFWEVYTGGRVWTSGITFNIDEYALKPDYSTWAKSLVNGNLGHAIP